MYVLTKRTLISEHELLFISLDFMTTVSRLHDEYTYNYQRSRLHDEYIYQAVTTVLSL